MSIEDKPETRQKNELEALQAIFGDDLRDVRGKRAWNVWTPLDLVITLTPQQGGSGVQEAYVKVDLHVICSKNYPNTVPKVNLDKSVGMSTETLKQLQQELEIITKDLVGEVMIFELAQHVQSFLHQHNKPRFKSFYEEMLTRQKQEEQIHQLAIQEQRDRERKLMMSEIQQRQEILKQEAKTRRDSNSFGSDTDNLGFDTSPFYNRKNSYNSSDNGSTCEHKGTKIIDFSNNGIRQIQRGSCLSHFYDGKCVLFTGIDVETGELFHVWEWVIDSRDVDFTHIQRQLSSIEQEFNYLVKLRHTNLLHYVNMKQQIDEKKVFTIYILQEFTIGLQCSCALFNRNIPSDVDLLRNFSHGVLTALEFLHRNNVVHKNISEYCIYLAYNGLVLISNYSIDRRLADLIKQHSLTNYSKKSDILKFGAFILALLKGTSSSHEELEIPVNVSPELYDFLSKCLAKEDKERFTAAQLLSHPFIRNPVDKMSPRRHVEVSTAQNLSPEPPVDTNFIQSSAFAQSRVQSEFEVLQFIGKGAFGDVLKVRNKLDGGSYAIKRIELNPKNKQFNKKIIREVKLLSKLNHENVVRYYNAWIEMAIEYEDGRSSGTKSDFTSPLPRIIQQKELTLHNDVELLAPPVKDVEWSLSYEGKSKSKPGPTEESSSDESDEEWGLMINIDSSDSDSVQFQRDGEESPKSDSLSVGNSETTTTTDRLREIQYLYIQMEFCEKSTLRTAIDDNLYLELNRVWRLFREIVEGLAHIHQQGIIHRDLKPVNIFLDSNDHVKIGDFGLATTNILCRHGDATTSKNIQGKSDFHKEAQSVDDGTDTGLTGQVGTALYTAPELNTTTKTVYSQKVDTYSLGIIFFEMCYIPLTTQMERMKILSGIRSKEVIFPGDFIERQLLKQETLLRWLLNHDVSQRPTSQELLQSELIPPPVLEEEKLREMFSHTLRNPQLKAYKYLVASCFEQPVVPTHDITYDMDITTANTAKLVELYQYAKRAVTQVFSLHGGQNISTPLLLPKAKFYEHVDTCVNLMTHSGSVVSLPHDLRIPFARYVAFNGITLLKRYSIERVYRERKVFGYHPRELYECAFDIVTPSPGTFMVDAEILFIVNEIIDALPALKNKNFLIRLNHASLLKAILLHCGIKERHNDVYQLLSDTREGKATKYQIKTFLIGLGLSDLSITTFFNLIELENSLPKIASALQVITRKKSTEASNLASQALQELKMIIQNAEALGVSFNILIVTGLVYNINQYSGMLCQFVCELKKKRRGGDMDVLAAGGRYDSLIYHYRNIKEAGKNIRQFAVGISLSLDKLVQALQKEGEDEVEVLRPLDCIVSSIDCQMLIKEKISVLKNLWSSGIRCSLVEAASLEEVQEYCGDLKVPHLIILNYIPQGTARIRSWERDRFQEKTVNIFDLVEYMQRIIKIWDDGCLEQFSSMSLTRSDSKSNYEKMEHNHEATVTILFVTSVKLSANARRRYENQIRSQLDGTFKKLTGEVVVLGLSVEADVIRTLSAFLNFDSEHLYQPSVNNVIDRHPRHKKYLIEVCDEIYEQQSKRSKPILVLYSIMESFYKCIL